MSNQILPTKSQLLATKKSLKTSPKKALSFLDRKRNVLIREIMTLLIRQVRSRIKLMSLIVKHMLLWNWPILRWETVRNWLLPFHLTMVST